MEDMKQHLPSADMEKLKKVVDIKEAYNEGRIGLNEARQRIESEVGTLQPYEIALAEQQLKEVEDDECRKEDIQKMLELFEGVMSTDRPALPADHPIACYYQENDELRKILLAIEDLAQYPVIKNQWIELYDRLAQYRLHLSRKQNQLYATLEKKGFDRPTTTMWQLDDFIRDEIKKAGQLLDCDKDEEFIAMQPTIVADIRDLMSKEEHVLYPTSLAMITPEEFEHMKEGDREIGFAWIAGPSKEAKAANNAKTQPAKEGFAAELANLLHKYGYGSSTSETLDVTTGKLSLEQINLIYRHMPVDLSFVDENERVCFYTDTKHRVFPRSKNVIGRDVKNCHPRSSVHIVEEIIEKFRSGEQNKAEFWINKPGMFIYITYTAVRDEEGHFKGVLEMMQDCTHIRSLEGSRTLLTWDNEKHKAVGSEKEEPEQKEMDSATIACEDISPDTPLASLFAAYPHLKSKMEDISPRFKMLKTPLARVLLPKATIRTAAEKSGIDVDKLIKEMKAIILSKK